MSTTTVRIAVAKLEFTPSIPILARMEVNAAKRADNKAKTIHILFPPFIEDIFNIKTSLSII